MTKILIVEDEPQIREIEKDYLEVAGFETCEADDGLQAIQVFQKEQPDLVLLDLNLPNLDGLSVCREIRKKSPVPIIMVTARTKETDELVGLDVGADDYVKKPFSPRVLVARVQSLLKRPHASHPANQIIEAGPLKLDLTKYEAVLNGKSIDLTNVQFNMLARIAEQPGKVFSRQELLERTENDDLPAIIFDRTIDSHIKNIRKKIEKDSRKPHFILTIRGAGYKFNEKAR
ncbi:response regulator [Patescibacteria group bacterium]